MRYENVAFSNVVLIINNSILEDLVSCIKYRKYHKIIKVIEIFDRQALSLFFENINISTIFDALSKFIIESPTCLSTLTFFLCFKLNTKMDLFNYIRSESH